MARYVALLRAVNLGSYGKLAMKDLRELLEWLDFTNVKTLLQSGSAVFDAPTKSPAALEEQIQDALVERLDFETEVFVRTVPQWTKIVSGNPFAAMAKKDPSHLVVMVLRGKVVKASLAALQAPGPEELAEGPGCLYITYPEGIGRSKLNANKAWKTIGAVGTGRNWNTARKIADALRAESD